MKQDDCFFDLNPKKTALLLIEFQNEFAHPEGGLHNSVSDCIDHLNMLKNSETLLQYCRAKHVTIIHAPITHCDTYEENAQKYGILYHVSSNKLFNKFEFGAKFFTTMEPMEDEYVVKGKHGLDTFAGTDLDTILSQNKILNLAICGFLTNCCVESTMRTGYEFGYNVVTIKDCCAAASIEQHESAIKFTFPMFSIPMSYTEFVSRITPEADSKPSSIMYTKEKRIFGEILSMTKDNFLARVICVLSMLHIYFDGELPMWVLSLEIMFTALLAAALIYCFDRANYVDENSLLPSYARIWMSYMVKKNLSALGMIMFGLDVIKVVVWLRNIGHVKNFHRYIIAITASMIEMFQYLLDYF